MPVSCEIIERDVASFIKNRPNATTEEIKTTIALLEKQSVDDAILEAIKSGDIKKYLDEFKINIDKDYYDAPEEVRNRITIDDWRQNALDELATSDRYVANNIYKAIIDGRIGKLEVASLIERGLLTKGIRKEYEDIERLGIDEYLRKYRELEGIRTEYKTYKIDRTRAQIYDDLEKELRRTPTEREILQRIELERETYKREEAERIPIERETLERVQPEYERAILNREAYKDRETERIIPESERIVQEDGRYVPPERPIRYPPSERPPRYPPPEKPPPTKGKKLLLPYFEPFDKEKIMNVYKGIIAWKQGKLRQGKELREQWYIVSPPYATTADVKRQFSRPRNAFVVSGLGSAYQTVQQLGFSGEAFISMDWGMFDLLVRTPIKTGDVRALQFKYDTGGRTRNPVRVQDIKTVTTMV